MGQQRTSRTAVPTPGDRCLQPVRGLTAKAQTGFAIYASRGCSAPPPSHLGLRNHAGNSVAMICPEHLEALGDLGYNEKEARFLYLVATHSGYFTLRQFLDFTGTAKGWNVHQFTSKSIRLGHVRAATCGYCTSVFNLYSRKVYGALDRDSSRNRRRLSSELIRTRLLILDFVLAHPGLEYLESEAEKVAYFRELAVPEALIPGRVDKGIDPNSTTKRCFVERFPVFSSACITHLRHYEHFLRLSGFYDDTASFPSPFRVPVSIFRATPLSCPGCR